MFIVFGKDNHCFFLRYFFGIANNNCTLSLYYLEHFYDVVESSTIVDHHKDPKCVLFLINDRKFLCYQRIT